MSNQMLIMLASAAPGADPQVLPDVLMIANPAAGDQYVEADGLTVHTSSTTYLGATADHFIYPSEGGVWQFEATIVSYPAALGIGISTTNPPPGSYLGEGGMDSFCFNPTNAVLEGTMLVTTAPPNPVFAVGQVAGVVIDFDNQQVKLYRNGVLLITVGIMAAAMSANKTWYPAICDVLAGQVLVATAEFQSMAYPIAGALPWAAGAHS